MYYSKMLSTSRLLTAKFFVKHIICYLLYKQNSRALLSIDLNNIGSSCSDFATIGVIVTVESLTW